MAPFPTNGILGASFLGAALWRLFYLTVLVFKVKRCLWLLPVLSSVADPIFLSRIHGKKIPDPGSGSFQAFGNVIREVHPDPDLYFLPIPDPGSKGKKAPDPQHCYSGGILTHVQKGLIR
jgi:hypothetical protein